ncbi:DUF29 family protein [uncultured Methylobacterium sp.]|uniref:DUF29 family protein n=1 Tax=uncultured Methylobacterium sp. TaxID=157278 RepID=UPI0035CA5577
MALGTQTRLPETITLNDVFEAERHVVGLILAEPATYRIIAAILRGEDWTERLHRGVFEIAGELAAAGRLITLESVLPRVSDVGPDGAPAETYLAARIAEAPPSSQAKPLAQRLAAAARARHGPDIYDHDLYAWAFEQAQRLRRGQFSGLDALNLAEEIEDLGSEIYRRLESALRITLMHLLKWDHQPEKRTRSWTISIRNSRLDAEEVLERHPGVKRRLANGVARAYRRARIDAAGETGLDEAAFPAECPYPYDDIMNRAISWPPEPDAP